METIKDGLTKRQRYYAWHVREGLCQQCNRKAVKGRTCCELHAAKQHDYHIRRYKRRPRPIKPSKYLTNGNN